MPRLYSMTNKKDTRTKINLIIFYANLNNLHFWPVILWNKMIDLLKESKERYDASKYKKKYDSIAMIIQSLFLQISQAYKSIQTDNQNS